MTKEIPLTRGLVALVDDDMYDYLNQWNWYANCSHGTWYAVRNGSRLQGEKPGIRMHRIVVNAPQCFFVDHVDGNGLNNQKQNLRICTLSENNRNRKIGKNGHKGVVYRERIRKYQARININGKQIELGVFNDENEAAKAYDKAAIELHGEFARTNFKQEKKT